LQERETEDAQSIDDMIHNQKRPPILFPRNEEDTQGRVRWRSLIELAPPPPAATRYPNRTKRRQVRIGENLKYAE